MRFPQLVALHLGLLLLALPRPAAADLSHWFFQAKVDFGLARVYDVTPDGLPLPDKKQGRSRTSQKMFGLVDVKPLKVCAEQGSWMQNIGVATKRDDQRLEFYFGQCSRTLLRVHFNRPIEPSDYAPEAIVRYLSGMVEVHGFGTDGLSNALGAALTDVSVDGDILRVGGLELRRTGDYQPKIQRYGGGLRLISAATSNGGKRYHWSTLILSRPMTPQEAAIGPEAVVEQIRRDESRMLNATFGKRLKKRLDIVAGRVHDAPHLSIRHLPYSYRRRDYVVDAGTSRIYYLESTAGRGKKHRAEMDHAVDILLASGRFVAEPAPASSLSLLADIPEASLDDLTSAEAPETDASSALGGDQTYAPAIEVISVAVQPAEVSPGDEIRLLVQYRVSGIPPGVAFEVEEERELVFDDRAIAEVIEATGRTAGEYTSAKTVAVPRAAEPGVYTLRSRVSLAGISADGSALFRVR